MPFALLSRWIRALCHYGERSEPKTTRRHPVHTLSVSSGDAMTTDRVRIPDPDNEAMKEELAKVDFSQFIQYGIVKVQVRNGKPVTVSKEETVKLD